MGKCYRSELVFLLGDPVDDNPTGAMMEEAFRACGLDWRYVTTRVRSDDLPNAMKALRAMGVKGMNLTMPHKVAVLEHLDDLSPAARLIGAVNTVFWRNGRLTGDNTDGKGFIQALSDRGVSLMDKRLLILGAGGAARAIAVESALAGARKITISNRTLSKARQLADVINLNTTCQAQAVESSSHEAIPEDTDILVNATSIGLAPDSDKLPDLDYASVLPSMVVSDVVFYPSDSRFLQEAARRSATCVDGLGMLVRQGTLAFNLWTGLKAPEDVMRSALEKAFSD